MLAARGVFRPVLHNLNALESLAFFPDRARRSMPLQAMSAAATAAAPPGSSEALQAEAFQRLYPDQYLAKFVAQGVRPDGRPLALPRATSIGLGVVTTADASALVKIGSTSVLAGTKCEVMPASTDEPDKGRLAVQVGAHQGPASGGCTHGCRRRDGTPAAPLPPCSSACATRALAFSRAAEERMNRQQRSLALPLARHPAAPRPLPLPATG